MKLKVLLADLDCVLGDTEPAESSQLLPNVEPVLAELRKRKPYPFRDADPPVTLALVSSSPLAHMKTCLESTGLSWIFQADRVVSVQNSFSKPYKEPDSQIARLVRKRLGISSMDGIVALKASVSGVLCWAQHGIPVIGFVGAVTPQERSGASELLRCAGAFVVVDDWLKVPQALADIEVAL